MIFKPVLVFFALFGLALHVAAPARAFEALTDYGIPVTTGAAAGYVPDATCADCHQDKAESFSEMGMAKSFYRPSPDKVIEDFDNAHFYHEPSKRHYEMQLRGGEYWFTRYQLNADGDRIHDFEQKVDWILGSGHHSRVYLYQTQDGALFQLPLAWYSQEGGKWEMAPGFEFADQMGVNRAVRQRCMACHNAFPEVPEGSDRPGMPEVFPADLPEGIGCQRCHGPGADHVEKVLSGEGELDDIRAAIVHPGKLPKDKLYGICYGCHMQPSVAVTPELRLGRSVYSFRPGQDLSDYKIFLDIDDALRMREDRFDINHHPFRMEQSRCFTESDGQLGCLSCHDPHVKVKPQDRAAHYRTACLSCHDTDGRGLPVMQGGAPHPDIAADADCTTCHMPARRTQDVIHVTMTDHRIVRDPGPLQALTRPISKVPAEVAEVSLLYPDTPLSAAEKLLAKAHGVLANQGYNADYAAEAMAGVMATGEVAHYEPWLDLSRAYFQQKAYGKAVEAAEQGLALAPDIAQLRLQRAAALFALGQHDRAIAETETLVADHPDYTHARYDLALFYFGTKRMDQARQQAQQVVALQHTHWYAWRLLARIAAHEGEGEEAITAYLRALDIEPGAAALRDEFRSHLEGMGQGDMARRYKLAD
ncbi:tetratricopeptide repeat protein [Thalassovita mangrovi]|uniref:Tetratricopeptide repeat protein n=1 Tax=Thalassovita mangrovi TaxID=2692236 RepID=A0A6L8LVW3_9RHOB|nr:tetratricopeptide repeat protein [Thalassovita mangrovi]MYM57452.1 tetratricopeptide repeat protein [Thalassovita mangrovi]